MARMKLKVTGMTCGHCVHSVQTALERVSGVRSAQVELRDGTAIVDYDDSTMSAGALQAAVKGAGYQAVEVD